MAISVGRLIVFAAVLRGSSAYLVYRLVRGRPDSGRRDVRSRSRRGRPSRLWAPRLAARPLAGQRARRLPDDREVRVRPGDRSSPTTAGRSSTTSAAPGSSTTRGEKVRAARARDRLLPRRSPRARSRSARPPDRLRRDLVRRGRRAPRSSWRPTPSSAPRPPRSTPPGTGSTAWSRATCCGPTTWPRWARRSSRTLWARLEPVQGRQLIERAHPPRTRGDRRRDELRARGYRLTPQRQLVLDAVDALGHATPDEVHAWVRERVVRRQHLHGLPHARAARGARPGQARAPEPRRADLPRVPLPSTSTWSAAMRRDHGGRAVTAGWSRLVQSFAATIGFVDRCRTPHGLRPRATRLRRVSAAEHRPLLDLPGAVAGRRHRRRRRRALRLVQRRAAAPSSAATGSSTCPTAASSGSPGPTG